VTAPKLSTSWFSRATTQRRRDSTGGPWAGSNEQWPELPARFRIIERLGSGGMGSVFRVLDREQGCEVALKTLHGVDAADRRNLKREFRALSDIAHPNLVALHELVVDGPHCFFTMELVLGVSFVLHVRNPARAEAMEFRLHDAARQLALAINALHLGGKVHRDIKPLNALVSDAGRVVLLDFGLAASSLPEAGNATVSEFAGTVEYAPPEQIWGEPTTEAADWYSFGATLYEAVSGEIPLTGPAHEVAFKKRQPHARSLREQGIEISPALDALIQALLHTEPQQRPSGEQILQFFGAHVPAASLPPARSQVRATALIGREQELSRLAAAFAQARAGQTVVYELTGTSGIGKSALVRRFLADWHSGQDAVLLSSRCHPQEALAFNAIDGLVDDLAQLFDVHPELKLNLPPDSGWALARLFPELAQRLGAERGSGDFGAMQDARRLAFAAFRGLLEHIASSLPVLVWIDDAQWADEDSGALLAELLKPPHCRLLTILSYRAEDRARSAGLRVLAQAQREQAALRHECSLAPLDDDRSVQLVQSLLDPDTAHSDQASITTLLRGSEGSPFLLRELALFLERRGNLPLPFELSLQEMLRLRTTSLPRGAREILEVFAVAGAPLGQNVALRAAGLTPLERGVVLDLERLSMLRTTDVQGRTSEIYHHRIRDEVLRQLPAATLRERHRSIATALLSSERPNALLAVDHFEAAEDHESLRRYVVTAANQAYQAFAFERAARLYERAVALGAPGAQLHELHTRRALSLSYAGRSHEAARAFQDAAAALAVNPGADLEQGLELRQKAAEHFIQSGQYAEGLAAQQALMVVLDNPLPSSRGRALARATLLRLGSALRGVPSRPSRSSEPSARELLRFDALWSASIRLSMIDYALSSYAVARSAADALRIGEPSRLTRALALEATNLATLPLPGFSRRADALFRLSEQVAREQPNDYDAAFLAAARGVTACFRAQFRDSVRYMDQALELLQAERQARHYETALWQTWAMLGLAHLGEIRELTARAEALRKVGSDRGDRFLLQMANLGRPTLTWLAEDRPDYALEQIHLALSWSPSDYNTQHYWHYTCFIECEHYRGNFAEAFEFAENGWAAHKKNHFLQVNFARDELLLARARAALGKAALLLNGGAAERAESKALLKLSSSCARTIEQHGLACGKGWARLVLGVAAHLGGQRDAARTHLREALQSFEACGMQLYREACHYALGALESDSARQTRAIAWMREQGIQAPASMLRVLAPGLPGTQLPSVKHRGSLI